MKMRLIALGLLCSFVIAMGCNPPAKPTNTNKKRSSGMTSMTVPAPAAEEAEKLASVKAELASSGLKMVAMKVPTMTCPSGCYPSVKETLESLEGVASVELAKQSSSDAIDNPFVFITLKGDFDAPQAIAALAKNHFADAEVVQN